MSQAPSSSGAWFAAEWTSALSGLLESLSGERPTVACKTAPAGATLASASNEISGKDGEILWWRQSLTVSGETLIWVGASQAAWSQLSARLLPAAGEPVSTRVRDTYLDVLQQSLAELVQSAGRRWNQEVPSSGAVDQSEPLSSAEFHLVEMTYTDAALPPLIFAIAGVPENPAERPSSGNISQSKTFDLLMGVELPVSVSFGHVQLPLRDVLKLTAGSIVELNRMVDEPVEVIVNNCVVARGEVVVIEGNYGVRIHQILSRQQRLESLP